jgi:hypothetical protein
MYLLAYTLRYFPGISGDTTEKHHYEVFDSIEKARASAGSMMRRHPNIFDRYAISQIVETSQPEWRRTRSMEIED